MTSLPESHGGQALTDEQISRNYRDLCCIFCGYKPDLMVGRLEIVIINDQVCWCCLPCETATIPQGETT